MTAPMDESDKPSESSEGGRRKRRQRRGRRSWRDEAHDAAMAGAANHKRPTPPEHPLIPADDPTEVVTDDAGVQAIADAVRAAGSMAFDTEFIGEETYVPRLCLLQIATSESMFLIDPLADVSLDPIWELIADPEVEVIVHAGAQDLEPVPRNLGRPPVRVFDTQIAAGFLDLPHPMSLGALIEEFIGITLGKGMTFTKWDARPLSPAHLGYAADDVRYLPAIRAAMRDLLDDRGSTAWVEHECTAACAPERFVFDVERRARKLIANRKFRPRQIAVLQKLLSLRDTIARERNIPPRVFIKDDVLVRIAKDLPTKTDQLDRLRGMPWPVVESHGDTILRLIESLRERDPSELPRKPVTDDGPRERVIIDSLWSLTSVLARSRGIDPGLIGSRKDVVQWWFHRTAPERTPASVIDAGWRHEVIGSVLDAFVKGQEVAGFRWKEGRLRGDD